MYNPYNPYYPGTPVVPANGSTPFLPSPALPQKQEVIRVHGQAGAQAYQMPPNSSVLLLDDADAIVYLKTTDGAGYPTITPYTITPYVQAKPEDAISELDKRLKKLEEIIESDSATVKSKRGKSADSAD